MVVSTFRESRKARLALDGLGIDISILLGHDRLALV